jgi:hypothetical protein
MIRKFNCLKCCEKTENNKETDKDKDETEPEHVSENISEIETEIELKTDHDKINFQKSLKFVDIKIGTFNINLNQAIYQDDKIEILIHLMSNIDILCLQNIYDIKTAKILIKKILSNNKNLYIYPGQIKNSNFQSTRIIQNTFSDSTGENTTKFNNITISKYPFINCACVAISDQFNKSNFINITNINFNNIIISIYNVALQSDFTSISNINIREQQIDNIVKIINDNKENIKKDELIKSYNNYDINIMCGNLNINEFKNNSLNAEYLSTLNKLKGLDIYRFIKSINSTNIVKSPVNIINNTMRQDYILLLLDNIAQFGQFGHHNEIKDNNNETIIILENIKNYIFEKYRIIVKENYIKRQIDYFINFPIISVLSIFQDINIKQQLIKKEIAVEIADDINDESKK